MASTTVSDESAAANSSAIGSPTCLLSVFHSTPSAAPQDFPRGGAESISSEWLSRALDAKVTDFQKRICDEGQVGILQSLPLVDKLLSELDRSSYHCVVGTSEITTVYSSVYAASFRLFKRIHCDAVAARRD